MQKRPIPNILLAWLVAGTMDITAASIQYYSKTGKGPAGIFRYISKALIGESATKGGFAIEALGLAKPHTVSGKYGNKVAITHKTKVLENSKKIDIDRERLEV